MPQIAVNIRLEKKFTAGVGQGSGPAGRWLHESVVVEALNNDEACAKAIVIAEAKHGGKALAYGAGPVQSPESQTPVVDAVVADAVRTAAESTIAPVSRAESEAAVWNAKPWFKFRKEVSQITGTMPDTREAGIAMLQERGVIAA